MRERLPHGPYIDAVIRAIREAGYDTGSDCFTEYATDDGEVMLLEEFVDLGEDGHDEDGRAALAWRQTTGWLGGDYDGRGRYDFASEIFADDCVLPTPAAVAAFVRQWFNGGTVWPMPGADDIAPSDGPLPAPLAEALEAGDVTADLAVRLAAYWQIACLTRSPPGVIPVRDIPGGQGP